jgi:hypothetical protein
MVSFEPGLAPMQKAAPRAWTFKTVLAWAVVVEVSASALFPLIIIAKDPLEAFKWLGIVILMFGFSATLFGTASGAAYFLTSALTSHFVRRGSSMNRVVIALLFGAVSAGLALIYPLLIDADSITSPTTLAYFVPPVAGLIWILAAWGRGRGGQIVSG